MSAIKDLVELTKELELRLKGPRDVDIIHKMQSLAFSLQTQHAEVVERDVRVMQEHAEAQRQIAELQRQLAAAQAEDVRIHRAIEFRRGARTGSQWAAFCPKCHMPAIPYADKTMIECSTECGWMAPLGRSVESFISEL